MTSRPVTKRTGRRRAGRRGRPRAHRGDHRLPRRARLDLPERRRRDHGAGPGRRARVRERRRRAAVRPRDRRGDARPARTELLERFEIVGEDGAPLPVDELPAGARSSPVRPRRRRSATACARRGDERWSVVRSTPILAADGRIQLVINVFHDITEERRRGGAAPLPRRGEHAARRVARLRGDPRRSRRAARAALADYCIVDALDEDGHAASGRHLAPRPAARGAAPRAPAPLSAGGERDAPRLARCSGAASRTSSRTRASSALATRRWTRSTSRSTSELERGLVHRRPARGARPPARADLARHRRVGPALRADRPRARPRDRAPRRAGDRQRSPLPAPPRSRYAQLDTLLVSAPVGIGFWDRDLRFVRVNDALAALNRLPPEEHVGRTLAEVIPTLAPALEPLYRRVLESGEPVVHTESTDDAAPAHRRAPPLALELLPGPTPDGETIGVGGLIIEITDRKRADDRLRLLAEAGELFSTSLDRDEIAARIARVAVPRLADSCNVYVGSGDRLERIACVSDEPRLQATLESLPAPFALEGPDAGTLARVFGTREPVLLSTVTTEYMAELERLGVDPAAFDAMGTRSLMLLPIAARGQSLGVLTLGSRQPERFDEHDLDLAQELAGGRRSRSTAPSCFGRSSRAPRPHRRSSSSVTASFSSTVTESSGSGIPQHPGSPGWRRRGRGAPQSPACSRAGRSTRSANARRRSRSTVPRGALALADGGGVPSRHGLRVPRPDRGAAVEQLKSDFVSTVSHELRTPLAAIYGAAMTLTREDVVLDDEQREGMLGVSPVNRSGSRGSSTTSCWPAGSTRVRRPSTSGVPTRSRSPARSLRRRRRTYPPASSWCSRVRLWTAGRRRPGRAPPGPRQPGRERGQVLAGRRQGRARARAESTGACASRFATAGSGSPPPSMGGSSRSSIASTRTSRAASAAPASASTSAGRSCEGRAAASGSSRSPGAAPRSRSSCRSPAEERGGRGPPLGS